MSRHLSQENHRLWMVATYYKQGNKTRTALRSFLMWCVVMLFLFFATKNSMAGGLVDTSLARFLAADFTSAPSADITNPWWTLSAGSNFLYFAEDGGDYVWNLTEVLDKTTDKFEGDYAGTKARIVLDRGWVDEDCKYGMDFQEFIAMEEPEPEEVTYDWYAQDGEKNIWYMGEHTFDGDFGGSFVAGCDSAEAGIVLLGNPSKGDFYRQELYEGEAEDWGKVLNFKKNDGVVCMTTKEWTPLGRGVIEHKWYCSDGDAGELARIDELRGKTELVELLARDVVAPDAGGLPVNDEPSCADAG